LALLAKSKGLGPNIDFFSMKELDDILKKFKETAQIQQQPDDNNPMSNMFEQNMKNLDEGRLSQKLSIRRSTKKVDGTILNRHKNIVCIAQNV